jgi:hypothetical protein
MLAVTSMPRRSPRLHSSSVPSEQNVAIPPPSDTDPSRNNSVPAPQVAVTPPTPSPIPPTVNWITLTIVYTDNDDSIINIRITNDLCTITEDYIDDKHEKITTKSTIPLKNLATYLYTHVCAACLDEHLNSWKSVQFLCTFLPAMYITRAQLPYKRELIIQTLISHIQNMLA